MRGVGRENYSIYTWETDQTPQRKAKTGRKCCRSSRASLYCYSMQGVHIARSSERIRHEERQGDRPPQLPALRELEGRTEGRASSNCVGISDGHPPEKKGALSLYEPPKSPFYIRSEIFNPPHLLRPTPKRATSKIRKRSLF